MPAASSTRGHQLRRASAPGRRAPPARRPIPTRLVKLRLPCLATAHPGAGHDERRAGRDVEGAGAPATGAAGVDQRVARRPASRARHRAPERARGARHFLGRLALRPEPQEQRRRSGPASPPPASPRRTPRRPRHRSVTGLPRGGPARGGSGMKRRRARGDRGGGRRPGKRRGSRGLLSIKTKSCDACLGGLRRLDSGGHESDLPRADPLRRHRVRRVAATGNGPDCAGRS